MTHPAPIDAALIQQAVAEAPHHAAPAGRGFLSLLRQEAVRSRITSRSLTRWPVMTRARR